MGIPDKSCLIRVFHPELRNHRLDGSLQKNPLQIYTSMECHQCYLQLPHFFHYKALNQRLCDTEFHLNSQ